MHPTRCTGHVPRYTVTRGLLYFQASFHWDDMLRFILLVLSLSLLPFFFFFFLKKKKKKATSFDTVCHTPFPLSPSLRKIKKPPKKTRENKQEQTPPPKKKKQQQHKATITKQKKKKIIKPKLPSPLLKSFGAYYFWHPPFFSFFKFSLSFLFFFFVFIFVFMMTPGPARLRTHLTKIFSFIGITLISWFFFSFFF